jgi:hypothetical protein
MPQASAAWPFFGLSHGQAAKVNFNWPKPYLCLSSPAKSVYNAITALRGPGGGSPCKVAAAGSLGVKERSHET